MAKKAGALTPMMQQFFSFKQQHPDALLLFRCGDFYETYGDDASDAAAILGITLTRRNNGGEASDPVAMAGFPYHALDTYLPKLIRAGRRVAICDQLEDPKLAKTIVKRGITELVTPGVTTSDTVLQARENNFLAAVQFGKAACGLALLDISTGEFLVGQGSTDYVDKLLASFAPKEVLYERGKRPMFEGAFGTRLVTFELDDWCFAPQTAQGKLLHHFGVHNLKGFGVDHLEEGVIAAGVVMQYLQQTQHTNLSHITSLRRIEEDRYVRLDKFTVRNLELLHAMNEDGHSLLDVIDHTVTPMGGRLLRRWIVFPLRDAKLIEERQDGVEYYFREPEFRQLATEQLQRIGDLERLTAKMSMGRITPREVQQLRISLDAIAPLKTACTMAHCESMQRIGEQLNACQSMRDRIAATLMPDPPLMVAKGRVIKEGFNAELDELRQIAFGGKDYLLQIQTREAAATGIQSLKIGFNNVFGYYLEVRNTYKDQVPPEWVRKQTLVGAERYITQELKEYEEKILGAEDKILALETRLYQELVSAIGEYAGALQLNAALIAQLDCLLSMAVCAEQNRYIRPVVNDSLVIDIRQGRHPVIERELPAGETYVANDVMLDDQTQQIIIVTGPNMAGKSALLRQTALICLLAQMGSFVPAASAHIGMVDKIFTRVGASDNISAGESTFMVEMSEAASILNNLSERSLVLFDELGRGTSTYDGISIARAIVEHIHDNPRGRARTLFATHYHELNELEGQYERIKNYNVSVKEVDGRVLFVRRLVPGGSEHSFGIHVAKLAGMPSTIVKRANDILAILEQHAQAGVAPSVQAPVQQEGYQLSMFQLDDPVLGEIRDGILKLDIDNLTPVQALTELWRIKKILKGG